MDALTEMYRSAYFNSLKHMVIDKAKAIIKTNSDLQQEYAELAAACEEFKMALGKEEVNADAWVSTIEAFVKNSGVTTNTVSAQLKTLCDIEPSKFNS